MPIEKYCPLQNLPCSARCAWYDEVGQCCNISIISAQLCSLDDIVRNLDGLYEPKGKSIYERMQE